MRTEERKTNWERGHSKGNEKQKKRYEGMERGREELMEGGKV